MGSFSKSLFDNPTYIDPSRIDSPQSNQPLCTPPLCPHSDFCGGCTYQGVPYEEQLLLKSESVLNAFAEAGLDSVRIEEMQPSPSIFEYRNKMEFGFGNECRGGELQLGMHRSGSYISVTTTDECMLVPPEFRILLRAVLSFCKEKDYDFYHKKRHTGLLRNLILRKGFRTDEILVNIVTSSQGDFDEEGFLDIVLSCETEPGFSSEIVGVIHTFNDGKSDAVKHDEATLLHGRDYYTEKIMGLIFKVRAPSFFQTNTEAAERLYEEALSMLPEISGMTVLDLYCGTGTITQTAAMHCRFATGVDIVEDSIETAERSAAMNGIENCRFICGDVLKVLDEITETPDVIIADPPRAGIAPKAMRKIYRYGAPHILYISCNPKTLAENLKEAGDFGYEITRIRPYDNFPFTRHVECACLMSRRNP